MDGLGGEQASPPNQRPPARLSDLRPPADGAAEDEPCRHGAAAHADVSHPVVLLARDLVILARE